MKNADFNESSQIQTFTYERNPLHERSWRIMKWVDGGHHKEPIGDYTVLDLSEEENLSEKKVMNLVSIMNQKKRLMDLGEGTQTRKLYQIITEKADDGKATILFFTLHLEGTSKENAILRIDPDCIDLRDTSERQCAGASDSGFVRPELEQAQGHEVSSTPSPGI